MKAVAMSVTGKWKSTVAFLKKHRMIDVQSILEKYAQEGVNALSANTPVDTGLTAASWDYNVIVSEDSATIEWTNSNIVKYVSVALILQYGHATKNGGWIEGIDYVNPALQPVFDKIVDRVWKEVVE